MAVMEHWSSRLGFILASIGSAVGIGNIWRFSSVVGQNGGGAYLIPYLLAVFLCGVPLMILEFAIGRSTGGSLISAFGSRGRYFNIAGWLVCTVVFLILSYYLVVTGWTVAFALFSAGGVFLSFHEFTSSLLPVAFFLLSVAITGAIVSFGIRKGIERITTILIPLCFLILLGLVAFTSTLPGFSDALAYLFTPDFSVLSSPLIWSAALGQAFFSLSVGQGILTTYGTYLDRGVNIPRSSIVIAVADLSISLLAGLVIFPIVFTFGLQPSIGAELAFSTLPKAFQIMPFGILFATAFFTLLFFAATTSAISMLEVGVSAVTWRLGWSRMRVAALLTLLLAVIGLPSAMSYTGAEWTFMGTRVLDLMDETIGTLGLIVASVITALIFAWHTDRKVLGREIEGSGTLLAAIIFLCRFVIPVLLSVVLVYRLLLNTDTPAWHLLPELPYIGNVIQVLFTLLLIGAILAIILGLCWIQHCRWLGGVRRGGDRG